MGGDAPTEGFSVPNPARTQGEGAFEKPWEKKKSDRGVTVVRVTGSQSTE